MFRLWRRFLKSVPALGLWGFIWLASPAVLFIPTECLLLIIPCLWCSVLMLAPGKAYGWRLVAAAVVFLCFWFFFIILSAFISHSSIRPSLNLAVWVALGLHLMLLKPPLELALNLEKLLRIFLGKKLAAKIALSLALMGRLIPKLLSSAIIIRRSIKLRAANLPLKERLSLWGHCLARDAFRQSDELAKAIFKRWPWP